YHSACVKVDIDKSTVPVPVRVQVSELPTPPNFAPYGSRMFTMANEHNAVFNFWPMSMVLFQVFPMDSDDLLGSFQTMSGLASANLSPSGQYPYPDCQTSVQLTLQLPKHERWLTHWVGESTNAQTAQYYKTTTADVNMPTFDQWKTK